jgi:hypothetical protein
MTTGARSSRSREVYIRWLLGMVLVAAGGFKAAHPVEFHADLVAYGIGLPDAWLRGTAVMLPWLEVVAGIALGVDLWPETIRFVGVGLSAVFVAVLAQAMVRGLEVRCGCFGPLTPGWFNEPWFALGRALSLLAASIWLWLKRVSSSAGPALNA